MARKKKVGLRKKKMKREKNYIEYYALPSCIANLVLLLIGGWDWGISGCEGVAVALEQVEMVTYQIRRSLTGKITRTGSRYR